MKNLDLKLFAAKALPALSGESLTYNAENNVFLTMGYTSAANNTYFKAIRVSDRLVAVYSIGQGFKYTFLNDITLYAWDGRKAKIIAKQAWGGQNWLVYSDSTAKRLSLQMLENYLEGQAELLGVNADNDSIRQLAYDTIEQMQAKQRKIA